MCFHCLLFFAKRNAVTAPICPAVRDQEDASKDLEEQPQQSQRDKHSSVTSQPACNGPPKAGAWSRGCSGLLLSVWHPISRWKRKPHTLELAAALCTTPQASIHAAGSSGNHRIIVSLRLEKMSRIITSNSKSSPPCPLTTSLSATSPWFRNTSRDGDSTTSLGMKERGKKQIWSYPSASNPT